MTQGYEWRMSDVPRSDINDTNFGRESWYTDLTYLPSDATRRSSEEGYEFRDGALVKTSTSASHSWGLMEDVKDKGEGGGRGWIRLLESLRR